MTFEEARMMANVQARADRLFDDGYRARWVGRAALAVRNPREAVYRLDTDAGTCDCPFFQGHGGCHQCKHLLGWQLLLVHQRACRRFITLVLLRAWVNLDDGSQHGNIAGGCTP